MHMQQHNTGTGSDAATRSNSNELPSLASGQAVKVKSGGLIGQIGLKAGRGDVPGHQLMAVPVVGGGQSHSTGQR